MVFLLAVPDPGRGWSDDCAQETAEMTPRKARCANCRSAIFLPLGRTSWVHVDPRWYYCAVQQAVGYMPCAHPTEVCVPNPDAVNYSLYGKLSPP